jgi:hypothetical protein
MMFTEYTSWPCIVDMDLVLLRYFKVVGILVLASANAHPGVSVYTSLHQLAHWKMVRNLVSRAVPIGHQC